jgi:hypothetical protein
MGHVVVKQPDGLLAVWSSVVDDFVIVNATVEEIVEVYAEREAQRTREAWVEVCARAERFGTSSRMSPDLGWAGLMETRERIHGKTTDPRLEEGDEIGVLS